MIRAVPFTPEMGTRTSGRLAPGGPWIGRTGFGLLLAAVIALVLFARVDGVTAADCDKEELEIGIVKATGCFKARTVGSDPPVYDATTKFRLNG